MKNSCAKFSVMSRKNHTQHIVDNIKLNIKNSINLVKDNLGILLPTVHIRVLFTVALK
jgi:hypothetical protein